MANDMNEAVRRGAAFLDGHIPGWRARVNADRLDMSGRRKSVLGQLFGDADHGLLALGVSPQEAVKLGFEAPATRDTTCYELDALFGEMTNGWRELLRMATMQ